MSKLCKRFIVSGRVQGVFYRDSTRKKATELAITGWVRNNSDGSVELIACGESENLSLLEDWLWAGPPAASVDNVQQEESAWEVHERFVVRP